MDEGSRTDFDHERTSRRKLRALYILPCFYLFVTFAVLVPVALNLKKEEYGGNTLSGRRHVLEANTESTTTQCIPASIDSFPDDFFTQEQRRKGGVIIHFLIMLYTCAMLAVICDDYFLPSLDIISETLKLPSDVAGATFMAIGTSSPEFFSSVIGSFITEGDIGVGTVVGSAVFNVFGVTGLAGIAVWRTDVNIDWFPVTRDTSVYLVTIAVLTIMISDNIITWWESLILLIMFAMYVVLMYSNTAVESYCRTKMKSLKRKLEACCRCLRNDETTSLLGSKVYAPEMEKVKSQKSMSESKDSFSVDLTMDTNVKPAENDAIMKEENVRENLEPAEGKTEPDGVSLCSPPNGVGKFIWWLVMWPASLLFYFTIPDSRKSSMRKFFVITFLSSTVWLGVVSYVCVWMVTIIGYTLSIPDTVSGLTILAIGTSLPEMFSSVIVARNGLGNMVMANLIGSNIFDILFCLGAPWLIKTLTSGDGRVVINSSAMTYTSTTLLTTVVGLVLVFSVSGWKLNRAIGLTCIALYIISVSFSCLYELNVFGYLNPPTC